jgi:DNA-binding PadR family transcriptional regulator
MAINRDLVAASATPLILSILAEGENYGYAIIKRVHDLSSGHMQWTDGMLYPVLHRLEQQKLIRSFERRSKQGRHRRYYRLNKRGTKALADHKGQWTLVYSTLRKVWEKELCLT